MNTRSFMPALLAFSFLALADVSRAQDALRGSSEPIVGSWLAKASIIAGKVVKNNQDVLIEKDRMIWKRRDGDTNGETWDYTIDTTKEPKQISMVRTLGIPDIETGKPHRINAIYEHSEKEIRFAFLLGRNGSSLEERPINMTSTKENQTIVLVLVPKTVDDADLGRTKR